MSFINAQDECRQQSAILAQPKSLTENTYIAVLSNNKNIWLGASDQEKEGTFVWPDGTVSNGWSNWKSGEPMNNLGTEDCIKMDVTGKWNAVSCDNSLEYVCQINRNACPPGFTLYDGSCYHSVNKQLTYDNAKRECMNHGAEIVQPKDVAENNFIASIRNDNNKVWLAATDVVQESTFVGTDGNPISFTNWISGQPDDSSQNENCIHMAADTKWEDINCSLQATVVCKKNQAATGEALKRVGQDVFVDISKETLTSNVVFIPDNDAYRIQHTGRVIAWEVYSQSAQVTLFQVWRKVGKNQYRLIGQNSYTTSNRKLKYIIYCGNNDQIQVEKGDVIGIYTNGSGGVLREGCNGVIGGGVRQSDTPGLGIHRSQPKSISIFTVGMNLNFMKDPDCLVIQFRAVVRPSI